MTNTLIDTPVILAELIDFYDTVSGTILRGEIIGDTGTTYQVVDAEDAQHFPLKRDRVTLDNDPFTIDGVDYRLHNIILRDASRVLNGR